MVSPAPASRTEGRVPHTLLLDTEDLHPYLLLPTAIKVESFKIRNHRGESSGPNLPLAMLLWR